MATPISGNLDVTEAFDGGSGVPEPRLTADQQDRINQMGLIGADALASEGYFSASKLNADSIRAPSLPHDSTVLVIEDDAGTAAVILKVLESQGYMTRHAASRAEIIACFSRPPLPDVVLLDVMLPGLNGFDVLNRIRNHDKLKTIPVIMLTSRGERADIVKGLCYGADGYLTKPATPSALIEAVRAVSGG